MKWLKRCTSRVVAGCLAIGLVAPLSARTAEVDVEAALGTPVMLASQQQTAYLRVALTGFELDGDRERPPVNVAFVLDKSGSMGGDKIAQAKQAVRMAMGRLRDDDIVSVIAYDTNVHVLVPATRLTDRESVYAAVNRLAADRSTALFAGVSKGAGELRKFLEQGQVNRLILLSDGLANVGPSSPGELSKLGQSLGGDGIAVSTIGLGLDYNEDLMTRLAMASDGNHLFAEHASDLDNAFAREFGDVLAVVAQDVSIRIDCAEGIRPVRVLGREADIAGQRVRLALNQVYSEQMKYVILEVEVPAMEAGSESPLATVHVDYRNLISGQPVSLDRRVNAAFTDALDIVKEKTNAEVMADAVMQIGNERFKLATQLRDEGKVQEAQQAFTSNRAYLESNALMFDDKDLKEFAGAQEEAAQNLDEDSYKRQRKIILYEQHKITNQQR